MRESPREYLLSSKSRYQNSQDVEDAADVFFAIRNMLNHGLEVDWDDVILKKVLEEVGETKDSMGPAVSEGKGEKTKQRLRTEQGEKVGTTPKLRATTKDPDKMRDQFNIEQGLPKKYTKPKKISGDDEGEASEVEWHTYHRWGLVGARQRGVGARGGTGEEWEIPSRHHDVPVLAPLSHEDIDPEILRQHSIEWLAEHKDEPVKGQDKYSENPITYGHYLYMLTSRPQYGEGFQRKVNSEPQGPIHSLGIFSDARGMRSLRNTASHLSHETLDPDSDDYIEYKCAKRHAKNVKVLEECAKFPNAERQSKQYQKTHLHDRRAKNLNGDIPGKMEGWPLPEDSRVLPNSQVPNEIYQSSFREWLKRMRRFDVLAPDLGEKKLRTLYKHWFDLVHIDGLQGLGKTHDNGLSQGESFILSQILDDEGKPKETFSRMKIIHSNTYRRLRKESHSRVGFLPLVLGLQDMEADDRRLALAEFIAHVKEDPDSILNKGDQELEASREDAGTFHKQRQDDLMDHMISSLQRNWVLYSDAWKDSSFRVDGVNPMRAVYRQASDDRIEDIKRALSGLHQLPTLGPRDRGYDPEISEEGKGYDDPKKDKTEEKSVIDYLKGAKIKFKGDLPEDWDLDNDPIKEFSDKFLKFLPQEYQDSARRRFRDWWSDPPNDAMRNSITFNQKNSSHERDAVESVTLSEDGDHHKTTRHLERNVNYQDHRAMPKVGAGLRDADSFHILAQTFPFLGVEKNYSDIVIEMGYNTKPPYPYSSDNPAYVNWVEDFGEMSGLGPEVDQFLQHQHIGPKFQKMWDSFFGPLEKLTEGAVNADPYSSQRVMHLMTAILAEKLSDPTSAHEQGEGKHGGNLGFTATNPGDPDAPFGGLQSSLHEARLKDPAGRILGYRPPNSTIAKILAPILQPSPAFLPSASSIGIREKLYELGKIYEDMKKEGHIPREDTQQRIFSLHKELEAMGVDYRSLEDTGVIERNSSHTGAANSHQTNHSTTSTCPTDTQKNIELRMKYSGKGVAIAGAHDGLRDGNANRGASCVGGTTGEKTQSQKGIETGRGLLWYAKLFGIGCTPATYTDEDGEEHLALEKVMEWGDSHMGPSQSGYATGSNRFVSWLNSQSHPWVPGETMSGYTGVGSQESWRQHPKLTEDRYSYPVEEVVDDTGKTVHRMAMEKGVPVLQGHDKLSEKLFASTMHRERDHNPKYRPLRVGSFNSSWGDNAELDEANKLFEMGTIPEKYLDTDNKGKKYMIGEHPAAFLDAWADEMKARDPDFKGGDDLKEEAMNRFLEKGEPHSLTEDEHDEWFGDPEIADKGEASFRSREYEARTHATTLHAAIAMMPLTKRLFAQSAIKDKKGEEALEEYLNKYIREDDDDTKAQKQQKYINGCYLFEQSALFAHRGNIEYRRHIVKALMEDGFEFTDEEKGRYISDGTDNSPHRHLGISPYDVRYNRRDEWEYPSEKGGNDLFTAAAGKGKSRDVEGFHLLGEYIDSMYRDTDYDNETADYLKEGLRKYYDMYGERDKSGSPKKDREVNIGGRMVSFTDPSLYDQKGKPSKQFQSELDKVKGSIKGNASMRGLSRLHVGFHSGSRNQNRQDAVLAQHHEAGLPKDSPFPKHLSNVEGMAAGGESRSSAYRDIMRRGMRARNTTRLQEYLENVMKDDKDTNEFFVLLEPVMSKLADDLELDGRLPEHTLHQPIDTYDKSSIMQEFSRLLYLRGVFNHKDTSVPKPQNSQRLGSIGDDTSLNKDHENYGKVSADKLNLITSSGVIHDKLHTIRATPSHMIEIGHGHSASLGSKTTPGVVNTAEYPDEWGNPILEYPVTAYHSDFLSKAFGEKVGSDRDTSMLGGHDESVGSGDIVTGFMSLDVLTDVDLLLKEEDRDKGKPVSVKAMHRIFSIEDLEFLRGFSDDWVVSSWPSGIRLIVEKKGKKVKARNSDGKSVSLPNEVKRGVGEAHDKDFMVDAIWDKERLHIIDVLECDDSDLCDKPTKDRSRHLRAHFDSTEKVVTPAPVNTKRVDGEGLPRAVKELMKEPDVKQVLLRDAESSYMRGETRHPKWVMLNPDQLVDVLILSSSSVDSHLIGVGPLYDEDAKAIGNRAVRYGGDYYMDVGTVSRSGLEEGMYITVKTSGVSHSMRRKYSVYRLNAPRYVRESESGATDSIETLDILRNRQEGNIPHKVRIKKGKVHIEVPTGHVVYDTESHGNAFILKNVDSPDDYTLRVVESQREYWSPIAAVLLRSEKESKGKEKIEEEPPANHDKKPKKVLPKRDELLKDPEVVKTVVLALETVENMLKEKITMTGPKALGIDYATPVESPHGPTKITEPYDMPDHDPAARQKEPKACWCGAEEGEECAQGIGHNMENCPQAHPPKKEKKIEHLKISRDSHKDSSV